MVVVRVEQLGRALRVFDAVHLVAVNARPAATIAAELVERDHLLVAPHDREAGERHQGVAGSRHFCDE
jgi:hypothetical protein